MIYRLADKNDLPRLLSMVEQAKESFRARGIDQWQKGDPDGPGLLAAIGQKTVHVLDEEGQAIGMITVVRGPEASYNDIDGAWLNDGPYAAFHRVCVEESRKGQGLAARLFAESEDHVRARGLHNVRIDTHPDNLSMQHALEKSGYRLCGSLILQEGTEKGDPRLAYHKVL